jgi:hypothetical protein
VTIQVHLQSAKEERGQRTHTKLNRTNICTYMCVKPKRGCRVPPPATATTKRKTLFSVLSLLKNKQAADLPSSSLTPPPPHTHKKAVAFHCCYRETRTPQGAGRSSDAPLLCFLKRRSLFAVCSPFFYMNIPSWLMVPLTSPYLLSFSLLRFSTRWVLLPPPSLRVTLFSLHHLGAGSHDACVHVRECALFSLRSSSSPLFHSQRLFRKSCKITKEAPKRSRRTSFELRASLTNFIALHAFEHTLFFFLCFLCYCIRLEEETENKSDKQTKPIQANKKQA